MTLVIPNADKALLDILNIMNSNMRVPYTIIEKNPDMNDILSNYDAPYSYQEIKEQMQLVVEEYRVSKDARPLGSDWK